MKISRRMLMIGMVLVGMILSVGMLGARAETLGDKLREAGWEGIIGTWVDVETKGERVKTTYTWKFKDKLIQVTNKTVDRVSVAWLGLNAKTGEVFHFGADNEGGSSLGKWSEEDGEAVLELGYVMGTGVEGELLIRQRLEGEDRLVVTLEAEGAEPVVFDMVRAEREAAEKN
jgi:hypothetical protein